MRKAKCKLCGKIIKSNQSYYVDIPGYKQYYCETCGNSKLAESNNYYLFYEKEAIPYERVYFEFVDGKNK